MIAEKDIVRPVANGSRVFPEGTYVRWRKG